MGRTGCWAVHYRRKSPESSPQTPEIASQAARHGGSGIRAGSLGSGGLLVARVTVTRVARVLGHRSSGFGRNNTWPAGNGIVGALCSDPPWLVGKSDLPGVGSSSRHLSLSLSLSLYFSSLSISLFVPLSLSRFHSLYPSQSLSLSLTLCTRARKNRKKEGDKKN